MLSTEPIIRLDDVSFGYPGRQEVLRHLDFTFCKGDRIGLVAPNGSGKTTIFHLIMGLIRPTAGRVSLFGKTMRHARDFAEARRRIGLLFQDPDDQLFSPTVLEDVAFGPLNLGRSIDAARRVALRTLADLGLEGFENRITFKLSGGEKRLVSLATVLAMDPEVLLLDEPLNALDADTGSKITAIISSLDQSTIIISHDIDFLLATTDRIYTLQHGRIVVEDKARVHVHHHIHPHGDHPHNHA